MKHTDPRDWFILICGILVVLLAMAMGGGPAANFTAAAGAAMAAIGALRIRYIRKR